MTEETITRIFIDHILWLPNYRCQDFLPPVLTAKYQFIYKVHKHRVCGLSNSWDDRSGLNFPDVKYYIPEIHNTRALPFIIPYFNPLSASLILFSVSLSQQITSSTG